MACHGQEEPPGALRLQGCNARNYPTTKGRARNSSRSRSTAGLIGEALIAGATLYGQATTPPEPPNTDQLDGSQSGQHDRWRDSTNEASDQRSRPGTNQPK